MSKVKVVGRSAREVQAIQMSQGYDKTFSKALTLNSYHTVLIPKYIDENGDVVDDFATIGVAGRSIDMEVFGSSFIPFGDDAFDEETGKIVDNSILAKYARIASAIYDAQFNLEVDKRKRDLEFDAQAMGRQVDQRDLTAAIDSIREQYYGNYEVTPNVLPTKKRLISGIQIVSTTRVYVIPKNEKGVPLWKNGTYAQMSLSKSKLETLYNVLGNPDNQIDGRDFLEVSYAYIGSDTKNAGRTATFQGVSKDVSIESKFPELWAENRRKFKDIHCSDETLISKNISLNNVISLDEFKRKFHQYISNQEILLTKLNFDSDTVAYAAKDILEEGLCDNLDNVKQKLIEIAEGNDNKNKRVKEIEKQEEEKAVELMEIAKNKSLSTMVEELEEKGLEDYAVDIENL